MNVKKRKRFVGTICLMLSMVLLTVPMLGMAACFGGSRGTAGVYLRYPMHRRTPQRGLRGLHGGYGKVCG